MNARKYRVKRQRVKEFCRELLDAEHVLYEAASSDCVEPKSSFLVCGVCRACVIGTLTGLQGKLEALKGELEGKGG